MIDLINRVKQLLRAFGSEYDGSPDLYDSIVTGFDSSALGRNIDGAVLEKLEAILQKSLDPTLILTEFWMQEAIDGALWATAVANTGTVAFDDTEAGYLKTLLDLPAGAGGDAARLRSVQRYVVSPGLYGTNSIARRLILEFEAKLGTVANLNNTVTMLGLATTTVSTRATNDLVAFILDSDDLASLTDDAGGETLNAIAGLTLTNWNKYRIEVYSGGVKFYVNETLKQTHVANLPDQVMYITFYGVNDAGGASAVHIGKIRCWLDDEPF